MKTDIPINNGAYKTKHSKPVGLVADIEASHPSGWIFNQCLLALTWKGGASPIQTDWNNSFNWIPRSEPDEESEVNIPSGKTHYPILVANASAKSVAIATGASIDLAIYHILTTGSAKAKLNNSGKLLLSGTNAQKAWFEDTNVLNKIVLENGSTVVYHAGATDPIYAGPYKNLNLSRSVSAVSLTVENITKVEQAISITADNQTYRGKVNTEEAVSFATTNENGTINFDNEVLAKNTSSNTFKDVTITKGVAIAKNKIIANKLEVIGKSFVAEKNIELEDNFEGKSKKIET